MAIDTPARIAIIGAGPIGLETALYARFLGYDVDLFEQGQVAEHVRQWSHVQLFSPFAMNHSPLGRSALLAQDESRSLPADDALLTGAEWIESYLEPLSQVDLLSGCLQQQTQIVSIGKEGYLKSEMASYDDRFDELFLILARDTAGQEYWHQADIVIDTSGTYGVPKSCGPGGMPAAGELKPQEPLRLFAHEHPWFSYRLPDILGTARDRFANQHVLVVGCGYSAATNLAQLLKLKSSEPQTKLTWLVRSPRPEDTSAGFPMKRIPDDRLTERDRLALEVNKAVEEGLIELLTDTQIQSLSADDEQTWHVEFCGENQEPMRVNAILANVGFRGDWSTSEELQVHRCYASGAPMKWSAQLLGSSAADCLDQTCGSAEALVTTEPNFYVLGAKSYGRWSNFLFQNGLRQIQQLFTLIADREDLDLYRSPLTTDSTEA